MSKNYKDCDIVFDLLPLYVEEKTCEESNAYIQEHVKTCPSCKETLELMQKEIPVLVADKRKRRRFFWKRYKGWIWLGIGIVVYLLVVIAAIWYFIYPIISSGA